MFADLGPRAWLTFEPARAQRSSPAGRSEFDNNGVTVRRLLSHTAGLTDGLGYHGFPATARAQSLEDSLTYAADRMPDVDGHVRVGHAPGSRFQYSGGGFALLQLIIEEVTHDRFAHFMQQTVLGPVGMTRSTYDEDVAMARGVATPPLASSVIEGGYGSPNGGTAQDDAAGPDERDPPRNYALRSARHLIITRDEFVQTP